MDEKKTDTAIAKQSRFELTVTNSQVLAIARTKRWHPGTVVARVGRALPSPIEQQLYLMVALDSHLNPESFAICLREIFGSRELDERSVQRREVGKNLVTDRIGVVSDVLMPFLELLGKIHDHSTSLGYSLSAKAAAQLAVAYGEDAMGVVDAVDASIDELRAPLHFSSNAAASRVGRRALHVIAEYVGSGSNGRRPHPLDPMEIFDRPGESEGNHE